MGTREGHRPVKTRTADRRPERPPGSTAVYMTTQGSTDTTGAIVASDARLGVESSHAHNIHGGHAPRFIDYPFTDPESTFADHLAVVREHRPEVAVAPDVEQGRTLAEVVDQADRLAEYADAVVVVPKACHPRDVPARFRVGVPAANFGSGAPWSLWAYRGCGPVHILGGPPARQFSIGAHLPVASVDTATLGKRCRFGMWDQGSQDAPDGWDYARRLEVSLTNYAREWSR